MNVQCTRSGATRAVVKVFVRFKIIVSFQSAGSACTIEVKTSYPRGVNADATNGDFLAKHLRCDWFLTFIMS